MLRLPLRSVLHRVSACRGHGRVVRAFSSKAYDPLKLAPLIDSACIHTPSTHTGTVIWLHDLGESTDKVRLLFQLFTPSSETVRLVVPQAEQIPVGAYGTDAISAWFDIPSKPLDEHIEDDRGMALSTELIHALLDTEWDAFDPTGGDGGNGRLVLGGFGQGGAMALHAGLTYPRGPLGGILSCSGYVPLPDNYPEGINEVQKKTPVLAIHGRLDNMVPLEFAKPRYQRLRAANVPLQVREDFHLGHFISETHLLSMQRWWKDKFARAIAADLARADSKKR